jgi:hypothetical protein
MKELAESAGRILTERLIWENKQRLFYRMRHDGLPRLNKPFATAADAHYPMIDMAIRKIKPFWMGQLTSGDRLCVFTALRQQSESISEAAADYFDFLLRNRSNYLRSMRTMIDTMLLTGRGAIKATVNPLDGYKLVFESINPMFILMPQEAASFEDADEFVHVRQFTVEGYKRLDPRWDTSDGAVKRIRGSKEWQSIGIYEQDVRLQEGISFTRQQNQILVYEHYRKSAGGWTVYTYCPMAPDIQLRKPYGVPYKVANKPSVPFFSFQMEVINDGWYAPRGLGDLLAPVEQYMTKLWNEKADAMTFANRPLYTGDKEIVNSANYRWQPGEYIPGNIKNVQQGPPPIDFDRELAFAQSIGEQQSQSPDFGIASPGEPSQTGGKPRTATENQRIAALQQSGGNDNAEMFREDLAKLYTHVWGVICQFKERDFTYFAAGSVSSLPQQALHDSYILVPDGAPDAWNKLASFQKAMSGLQAFQGNPNVDPAVLTKNALTKYDARMAQKAFVDTNLKGANEYEDEAVEINSLLAPGSGKPPFPAQVMPGEDHASRIKAIVDWMHAAGTLGTPVDPHAKQRVQQHLQQHLQALAQQNPAAARQIAAQLSQMEKAPMTPGVQPQPTPPQ